MFNCFIALIFFISDIYIIRFLNRKKLSIRCPCGVVANIGPCRGPAPGSIPGMGVSEGAYLSKTWKAPERAYFLIFLNSFFLI